MGGCTVVPLETLMNLESKYLLSEQSKERCLFAELQPLMVFVCLFVLIF